MTTRIIMEKEFNQSSTESIIERGRWSFDVPVDVDQIVLRFDFPEDVEEVYG